MGPHELAPERHSIPLSEIIDDPIVGSGARRNGRHLSIAFGQIDAEVRRQRHRGLGMERGKGKYGANRRRDHPRIARDRLSVGREEDWEAKGLLASRKMARGNQAGTVESVTHVMSEAPMPMSQALSKVSVVGETVQVEFQPPADLQPKKTDDRVVECLLY